ncbi:MAG: Lrp/AsnC family transcriptional regulator [Pedosphaera sp.]|nr:Lrp/AsnC family transcriptional regulator [Pedosphaera sp.]MSU42560.1 Lrp/AsnC family transcriptional regulator [Pedosphaera sp.]
MDELLRLLRQNASLKPSQIAALLNLSEGQVTERIATYEKNNIILGYRTVINEEALDIDVVRAVIEVKVTPERDGGFDRVAERIARFDEVQSCYLMSGGYDLLVVVEGNNLRTVASFVTEKLATMPGVISTGTHFMLKPYKELGVIMGTAPTDQKLAVSP